MSKIGLFFGSFNPIHHGHLIMANHVLEYTDIDKLLFVVSPKLAFKDCQNVASFADRCEMVRLATWNVPNMGYTTIEGGLSIPAYTIDTMRAIGKNNTEDEFCIIMGYDNYVDIEKWKEYEELLKNYEIFVCPRNITSNITMPKFDYAKKVTVIDNIPDIGISSSYIRQEIKKNKDVCFLLPFAVRNYIIKNQLYRNISKLPTN